MRASAGTGVPAAPAVRAPAAFLWARPASPVVRAGSAASAEAPGPAGRTATAVRVDVVETAEPASSVSRVRPRPVVPEVVVEPVEPAVTVGVPVSAPARPAVAVWAEPAATAGRVLPAATVMPTSAAARVARAVKVAKDGADLATVVAARLGGFGEGVPGELVCGFGT